MRNSGLIASLVALSLMGSTGTAQEGAIKVDKKATDNSRLSSIVDSGRGETTSSAAQASTEPKTLGLPINVFLQTEPVTVAEWDGGKFTNLEVSATLATRRPPSLRTLSPQQFAMLQRKQQEEVIKALVWERILLDEARKAGINETTPEVARVKQQQEESLLNRLYYENQISPKLEEMTLKSAQEFYKENLDTKFTQPALTSIRGLHVSTYEMVTAEEGDTLEDLANQISGSPDKANLIRQAGPPYFELAVPNEIEDNVLSSPLQAGEVLFVPMSEDGVSSATVLAEDLRTRLLDGATVDQLAADTSDEDFMVSATEPIQVNEKAGYYDEIVQAAASLDSTSVSQVVKTPAGLNILLVENRTTTNVLEFDDIKDILMREMTADETTRRETVEKTREEVLQNLWDKFDVKLNEEVLEHPNPMAPPDPLSTTTVIASVGDDFSYNLGQFITDLRMTGKDWGQLTRQERLDVLKIAPAITNYLTAREARELGLHETEMFKEQISGLIDSQIVAVYRKQQMDPAGRLVTEDDLRAFYNDNIDKYTSAAQVKIREISKRINMTLPPATKAKEVEEARKSLAEIRGRIKNEEDFAQLARRESEAISTRSRGGLIGTVSEDFRGEAFRNQVRQLEEGELSQPFLYGSEVMIVRLDDRLAPTVQPLEQVKREVMQDYALTMPEKLRNQEMDAALKKANFKITF